MNGLLAFAKALSRSADRLGDDAVFNQVALELFEMQFHTNAGYRKYCESLGIFPASVSDWRKTPAVPTAAFKDYEFTSIPEPERVAVFRSSGTTEQRPSRHFHNKASLRLYRQSLTGPFKRHFLPDRPKIRLLSLTPSTVDAPHSSLVHMFDTVIKEFGDDASAFAGAVDSAGNWSVDLDLVDTALKSAAEQNQPIGILSTAFALVFLLDELARRNLRFRLPVGSRALETGGYKGRSRVLAKEQLHAMIQESLGISAHAIICEYGMCELGSQAYDRTLDSPEQERRIFHFPAWARSLVISPETGREVGELGTGLIRIVDLANIWSVLAIQTEDIGIRRGAGFELLGRASAAESRGCSLMSACAVR